MRVGISLTSAHRGQDPRAGARWMIERAGAARRASLDSLFVGDHHATPGPYYQNVVFGTVAEVVERFRGLAAMGYTDVIVRHLTDEQPRVLGSLGRLAEVRQALMEV